MVSTGFLHGGNSKWRKLLPRGGNETVIWRKYEPVMGKYRVFRVKYLSNIVTDEYFKYPNIRGKYLNTVQISTNLC